MSKDSLNHLSEEKAAYPYQNQVVNTTINKVHPNILHLLSMKYDIPFITLVKDDITYESPINWPMIDQVETHSYECLFYKAYPLKLFQQEPKTMMKFFYEYSLTKRAMISKFQHVLSLKGLAHSDDHLALVYD